MSPRTVAEIIAAVLAAIVIWYVALPKKVPAGEQVILSHPAAEVKNVGQETIHPKDVVVYKPQAKVNLGLPQNVVDAKTDHVVTSSTVKADDHPHTITEVLDDTTGKTTTYIKDEPLPWLAAELRREIRLDYGVKNAGVKVGRLSATAEVLAVKAFHFGVNASLDTDRAFFFGFGLGWRF
jgi:hypothetical protein